jgi:hypothetical protein
VLGQSGNAYFHTDVYDDQERERRLFILGLYALLRNDSVVLQGNVCVCLSVCLSMHVYMCVRVCVCCGRIKTPRIRPDARASQALTHTRPHVYLCLCVCPPTHPHPRICAAVGAAQAGARAPL